MKVQSGWEMKTLTWSWGVVQFSRVVRDLCHVGRILFTPSKVLRAQLSSTKEMLMHGLKKFLRYAEFSGLLSETDLHIVKSYTHYFL